MSVLDKYEPKMVMKFFEEISAVPRGSYNEEKIADYLVNFANQRKLEVRRDKYNNVLIKKPATKGYEHCDTVIMQGHSDMVCVTEAGYVHDFLNDGLKLYVEDGLIKAKGTSLGADDGIGVAYGLAILDSNDIQHPNLEVVFTAGEEVGMIGASHFDMSWLKGKMLISFDAGGFTEGRIYVGSAGCDKFLIKQPIEFVETNINKKQYEIKVYDFKGGHSGTAIVDGGGNGSVIIGRMLGKLIKACENFVVLNIKSEFENNPLQYVIPNQASLVVSCGNYVEIETTVKRFEKEIQKELGNVDDNVKISIEEIPARYNNALTKKSIENIYEILTLMPNGVQSMNKYFTDTPETSINIGNLLIQGDELLYHISSRGAMESSLDFIVDKIDILSKYKNLYVQREKRLPVWDYKDNSKLKDLVENEYQRIYGNKPRFKVAHGSGEVGMFKRGCGEEFESIAIGPIIYEEHTANEYMEITSVNELYKFFCTILRKLKDI